MIIVNGKEESITNGLSLAAYLSQNGFTLSRIAVECNEEIVPKEQYDKKILKDGDVLEVLNFVGGG